MFYLKQTLVQPEPCTGDLWVGETLTSEAPQKRGRPGFVGAKGWGAESQELCSLETPISERGRRSDEDRGQEAVLLFT